MWNATDEAIPVTTRATEIISKIVHEQHSGKSRSQNLQKAAMLGSAHILWKVLLYKYKTYFTCQMALHIAQIVNTEQLRHCIP